MSMRRARTSILALSLCVAVGFTGAVADGAKKKKKKVPRNFAAAKVVNASIPDEVAVGASTPVTSTITVPKKFKGRRVADVDVTGIQTTGSGASAADDLVMKLTAPNGRTVQIWNTGLGDVSIGPLTLDDDTRTSICNSDVPDCIGPNQTLTRPFAGTANLLALGSQGSGPLSAFDGIPMRGTWTFAIWDEVTVGTTSVLNGWGLRIRAAKPVKK